MLKKSAFKSVLNLSTKFRIEPNFFFTLHGSTVRILSKDGTTLHNSLTPPQVSQLSCRSSDINSVANLKRIQILRHFATLRILGVDILVVNLTQRTNTSGTVSLSEGPSDVSVLL